MTTTNLSLSVHVRQRSRVGPLLQPSKVNLQASPAHELLGRHRWADDTLIQICSNLVPVDLLHLVQSSKIFALFLLGPSSAPIWKASRLLLDGFPDCPASLTEQQFAVLIFGTNCQRCGKTNIRCTADGNNVLWKLQRRWCINCRSEVVSNRDPNYKPLGGLLHEVENYVLILSVLPFESIQYRSHNHTGKRVYAVSALAPIRETVSHLQDDVRGLGQYLDRQRELGVELEKTWQVVRSWLDNRESSRANELDEVRKQRRKDLTELLVKDGHNEEIIGCFNVYDWCRIPGMGISKRLTPQAYQLLKPKIENILSILVQEVEERAKTSAQSVLNRVYDGTAYQETGHPSFKPPIWGIISHPDLQAPFNAWTTENTQVLCQQDSSDITAPTHLLHLMNSVLPPLQSYVEEQLLSLLPSSSTSANVDTLRLATSVFQTPSICSSFSYDQAIYFASESMWYEWNSAWREHPWPIKKKLKFHSEMSHIIAKLVQGCGLDVTTCTYLDLERREPYVICLACCEGDVSQSKEMMRWQQTFIHWETKHNGVPIEESSWKIATKEESQTALSDPKATYHQKAAAKVYYSCLLCGRKDAQRDRTLDNLILHIQEIHGVDNFDLQENAIRRPERSCLPPLQWHITPETSTDV